MKKFLIIQLDMDCVMKNYQFSTYGELLKNINCINFDAFSVIIEKLFYFELDVTIFSCI